MSVEVKSTTHSPRVIEPLFARVEAVDATWDEIVDAGLAALGETRGSLFGFGIEGEMRSVSGLSVLMTGTYTVHAHRD